MTELHVSTELGQAGVGGRRCRPGTDPQPLRCPPHQARVAGRIGRRHQQQPAGLGRQFPDPVPETLLDRRDRYRAGEPETACPLGGPRPPCPLDQRQRITARLGDDPVPDPLIQRLGSHRVQQRPRVVLPQPSHCQLRQSRRVAARNLGCEDQAHRLRSQAPGHEPQHLGRGVIRPLLVIDQAQQRPLPRHLGQQAQHRQANHEPVRRRPRTDSERGPQRITLRTRQTLQPVQHRRAQLLQPGEGQFHLRLETRRPRHPETRRPAGHIVQQR
jgi:hypothetical protein